METGEHTVKVNANTPAPATASAKLDPKDILSEDETDEEPDPNMEESLLNMDDDKVQPPVNEKWLKDAKANVVTNSPVNIYYWKIINKTIFQCLECATAKEELAVAQDEVNGLNTERASFCQEIKQLKCTQATTTQVTGMQANKIKQLDHDLQRSLRKLHKYKVILIKFAFSF